MRDVFVIRSLGSSDGVAPSHRVKSILFPKQIGIFRLIFFTLCYVLLARFSGAFCELIGVSSPHVEASPFYLPSGFGCLLTSVFGLPGLMCGLLGEAFSGGNGLPYNSIFMALSFSSVSVFRSALIGFVYLRRIETSRRWHSQLWTSDFYLFMLGVPLISSVTVSLLAVGCGVLAPEYLFGSILRWFAGDVLGTLTWFPAMYYTMGRSYLHHRKNVEDAFDVTCELLARSKPQVSYSRIQRAVSWAIERVARSPFSPRDRGIAMKKIEGLARLKIFFYEISDYV